VKSNGVFQNCVKVDNFLSLIGVAVIWQSNKAKCWCLWCCDWSVNDDQV